MAQLTLIDQRKLENLFEMSGGYILDFNDAKFARFFEEMGIDIDSPIYTENKPSSSKANRLRGFWEKEADVKVGTAVEKLIDYAEYLKNENEEGLTERTKKLISDCRDIASRLTGKPVKKSIPTSKDDFLAIDFGEINLSNLPIESQLHPILESRLGESQKCLENNANLAVIFLAGSVLEGALLGAAQKYPEKFNKSLSCPKEPTTGRPKSFDKWTLSQFINVGKEIGVLGEDVKRFSHGLRDFRNYIHPYHQMASRFNPDKNTAEICLQVLKAALSDLIAYQRNT